MRSCLQTALILYIITSAFFKGIALIGSCSQSLAAPILARTCIGLNGLDGIILIIILGLHYSKKRMECAATPEFHPLDFGSTPLRSTGGWYEFWLDKMEIETGRRTQSFAVMASWFQEVYLYPMAMIITGWILSLSPINPPIDPIYELIGAGIGFILIGSAFAFGSILCRPPETNALEIMTSRDEIETI